MSSNVRVPEPIVAYSCIDYSFPTIFSSRSFRPPNSPTFSKHRRTDGLRTRESIGNSQTSRELFESKRQTVVHRCTWRATFFYGRDTATASAYFTITVTINLKSRASRGSMAQPRCIDRPYTVRGILRMEFQVCDRGCSL